MSAEQHPVRDVGAAAVAVPVVDVVRLAPGRRAFASGKPASAVARGERDALSRREEALVATDIERLTVLVEEDRHQSGRAGMPFDSGERHRR